MALDVADDRNLNDGVYNIEAGARRSRDRQGTTLPVGDSTHKLETPGEKDWTGWSAWPIGGKKVRSSATTVRHNTRLLKQGIAKGVANSILIKINQIGTPRRLSRRHGPPWG